MNPLNRPMFVAKFNKGGYLSPALRYMAQNPDVFNASTANARARELTGLASQAQVERDAALHYAMHGQGEGREWGGRTFLGGLLEPRLGDTFGLSPERKAELEQKRDAMANPTATVIAPPTNNELVPLVPIDSGPGDNPFAEGGEVTMDNNGSPTSGYQSSALVQGYLAANPDVLAHATRVAQSQGVAPGQEFQRIVENTAREHYRDFGVREGRKIAGFPSSGNTLLHDEVRRLLPGAFPLLRDQTREAPSEGITSIPLPPIDRRMLAFANILANTRDEYDPGTQGGLRPEFRTGASSADDIGRYTRQINPSLYEGLIGVGYGDTNEDRLPGRVGDIINYMQRPSYSTGETLFGTAGGNEGLMRAYDQLGLTGRAPGGNTYADRQIQSLYDAVRQTPGSSINPDNTGGAGEISLGGPTGTGYDSFSQMIHDIPNWSQQLAVVPSPTPLGLLNTLYNMYTGNINRNPYDTSDATGTRPDRSVPSPMEFSGVAPTTSGLLDRMDRLQLNSPGYPNQRGGADPESPFGGFGSGGGGE